MVSDLKVLVIDDSPIDVEMIIRSLRYAGYKVSYRQVDSAAMLQSALQHEAWDVILADHSMPGFSAPEALAIVQNLQLQTPFFLVSGEIETDLAVSLMRAGACDYVRKTDVARLSLSVAKELEKVESLRQRDLMQDALEKSAERLRRAELIAGLGNWTIRLNDRTFFASEGASRLLGISGGSWNLDYIKTLVLPEYINSVNQATDGLVKQGRPYDITFQVRRPNDGSILDLRSIAEYDNEHGIVFGIIRDISEQIKIRKERAELAEHLAVASKLKSLGVMSSGIVHEMAQPLNAITILAESALHLQRMGIENKGLSVADTMEKILGQVERINKIASHIRSFANVDLNSETGPCDINQAVISALELLGRQLMAHGIQVKCDFADHLPRVLATEHSLEEVVVNLLGNALQALDKSGREGKVIQCRTWRQNGRVMLEVADNATGISDSDMKVIFEPFFSSKGGGEGMGLGLSIVQAIVNGCRGRIEVFNNASGGASFRIEMPPLWIDELSGTALEVDG